MLKTENSAMVFNVNVQQLEDLPILQVNGGGTSSATNGLRDPYALVKTIPGTTYAASLGMSANGNNGMNILIEGMTGNMPNPAGIVTMQTQPSSEAVQEVAVLTSNYSAEYGNISGGVMNVTMRSGTNRYHGSAYAYGVNEALNAAQPFSGLKNTQRRYDSGQDSPRLQRDQQDLLFLQLRRVFGERHDQQHLRHGAAAGLPHG
jgi:hypothetical protein